MASPTNPHLPDSSIEKSLEAGSAALKAKDYPKAIAHFQIAIQTGKNQPSGLKAQMGLVIAYHKTGKLKDAIALCSTLTQNPNIQVKTWATKTLKDLINHQRTSEPDSRTAATPAITETENVEISPVESSLSKEISTFETGFIPFETTQNQPKSITPPSETLATNDDTGFVPFEPNLTSNIPAQTIPKKSVFPLPATSPSPQIKLAKKNTENQPIPSQKTDINPESNLLKSPEAPEPTETSTDTYTDIEPKSVSDSPTEITPYTLTWRNCDRAQKWRPLKSLKLGRFWFEQIATAIALFFLTVFVVKFLMTTTNAVLLQFYLLLKLPFLQPISFFYLDPSPFLQTTFGLLFVGSPWLIDLLLKHFHGMQTLPMTSLFNYSKEANKILRSFCQKKEIPVPEIKILPTKAPLAMSYGCIPRYTRIVVSQGLLDQLSPEEIATIFARELGHIVNWDFAIMSLATIVLQIPYTIYWQAGYWGDRVKNLANLSQSIPSFIIPFLQGLAIAISSLSYGIFWLLRWPILWGSRRRVYYSDRVAAEITGNPNALTRAIVKIAIGIAEDIRQQAQVSPILESFEFLIPLGVKQALALGAAAPFNPIPTLLQWDLNNPYRQWLEVNNTHPLIGERLQILGLYAQYWQLETEVDLVSTKTEKPAKKGSQKNYQLPIINYQLPITKAQLSKLLLQGAPFFGIPMSLAIVGGIWLIGWIFSLFDIWQLDWLSGDRGILLGCLPIGFSLGTLIRINHFFPDIKPSAATAPTMAEILSSPETLPLDSQPVQLQGKLLGRIGIHNWLGQDLTLQTATGLVTLHHLSMLGPIGNLWPLPTRPSDLIGKTVIATGWLRRGATITLDLEHLQTKGGKTIYSHHPLWSTILALVVALWGAYIIFQSDR
jgi:Zn-dependent protease with chaperone function